MRPVILCWSIIWTSLATWMGGNAKIDQGFSFIFQAAGKFDGDPVAEQAGIFADRICFLEIIGKAFSLMRVDAAYSVRPRSET